MVTRPWPHLRHPAQVVVAGFATAVAAGTGLLMLPVARAGPGGAGVMEALFTSTSAVCVTGLAVVDTPGYWSGFGQAVILALIQVGGFGIMTFASLLVLLVSHRIGLKARMTAAAETKTLGLGDVRSVVTGVVKVSLLLEAVTALALTLRFATAYDEPWPRAAWLGVFHAVSAFNNAGFALYSDSLMGFVTDPWICLPIALAVIAGGLGFPVLFELRRRFRKPRGWSLHTKIVLWASGVFLVGGTAFITALEWSNPATLGPLDAQGKLLAGFFQGVMPRTAGFNSIDTSQMSPASWLGTDVLMFIGGASAGTAGGIKVTTFAVLFFVIYAEIRGEGAVDIFHRRLHGDLQRQALTVVLLSVAAVAITTVVFMVFSDHTLDQSLFEVTSAFATVGLSTGITADLAPGLQLLLVALMFIGRLGPITVASALALRSRHRLYDLPEERPIIG
ncbi:MULTISPECIES: TrkH family potassium uptake protein [Streptomyces]|jgi:potassium uptake TrkH family protein|uniref:TrkH family potassium uptake protein n=1 Tax=Streptomyces fungicidicus TaxID=68203 RepID=A0ACC7Y3L6_9ACTN|nr:MULTISPECIES: potassium transporter TrkG [Streptomyces]MBO1282622.1 TrkH family potassium uptake protein [Streptomyces sampsonii]MBF4135651.1 TrkH family potassium uptake protein [Streptomyces albidoflavus]NUV76542.1 TrkH family potassium uptake protein [Streptomyces fungicidicus]PAX84222.1 ATPase [Streptomyces albidoflavus]PAX92381.1 ATPase [Streptomyces albidoflavus]